MSVRRVGLVGFSLLGLIGASFWSHSQAEPLGDEQFKPIMEASLPDGFPEYTPVGRVEVKRYPAYRMAQADGGGSFWTLFKHIKRNKIEMTAPVQMDYGPPSENTPRESAMAFLYGSPDLGAAGSEGSVSVVDVAAGTVVSIGVRGARTSEKVSQARDQLLEWLGQQTEFQADGDVRVMAYNSPFIARDRQFFEVQIPVRKI